MSESELHDAWRSFERSCRLARLERAARVDAVMLHIVSTRDKRGHSQLVKLPPMGADEAAGSCRVLR